MRGILQDQHTGIRRSFCSMFCQRQEEQTAVLQQGHAKKNKFNRCKSSAELQQTTHSTSSRVSPATQLHSPSSWTCEQKLHTLNLTVIGIGVASPGGMMSPFKSKRGDGPDARERRNPRFILWVADELWRPVCSPGETPLESSIRGGVWGSTPTGSGSHSMSRSTSLSLPSPHDCMMKQV